MTSKELRKLDKAVFMTEVILSELVVVIENQELFGKDECEEENRRAVAFASKMFFEDADKDGVPFVALVVTTLNHLGISAKEDFDEKGRCVSLLVGDKILLQRLFLGC